MPWRPGLSPEHFGAFSSPADQAQTDSLLL